jgi:hypothetical protein
MAFNRRGNANRGGGGKRPPLEYVFTGTTYREVNGEKVEDASEEWQLAITLPTETRKGQRPLDTIIQKLTEIAETNGDLGARLVFYVSPRSNERTGEEFAATNILVQPKMESKQGSFRGRSQGGGRRDYPPQRAAAPRQEEDTGEDDDAPEDTPPKAQPQRRVGSGHSAPKSASPFKKLKPPVDDDGPPEYTEENVPI